MTRERKLPPATSEQAAQAWEAFHRTNEASATEHRELGAWTRRSPEHIEAYLRVSRTMHALRSPDLRWPDTPVETLIREAKAYTEQIVTPLRDESPAQVRQDRQRVARAPFAFALAATLLVAIGAFWIIWMTPRTYETRFGEQHFVRLADGSGVTLNTASRIEVKLSKGHRIIRLVQGQALFDVAHDPARPFDVRTGKTILRAVGTRFDVDMRPNSTTVTVVEGVVALTHGVGEALPRGNTPLLRASDRVVIDSSGPGKPLHDVRADEATAWTRQQLIFKGRKLGEVAEEFNRYNRERIVIDSPELRSQEITGVFKANDPASFVAFLSSIPGARIDDDANGGHVVTLDDVAESRP
jgi:transmembrane sensor